MPSILLLDCERSFEEKLKRQGFDVESGTIGFCDGIRQLPSPIYEKNIIIYNPSAVQKNEDGTLINSSQIKDLTPEYELSLLKDHVLRGATLLIFVNRIADELEAQREAYEWIPYMPEVDFTKDNIVNQGNISGHYHYSYLSPIVAENEVKKPALLKIRCPEPKGYPEDVTRLYKNRNFDTLGAYILRGKGEIIVLPQYKSNEDIITTFLNRVMPKLYGLEKHSNLINTYQSPGERSAHKKIEETEKEIKTANENLQNAKENSAKANREKGNIIKNDETAVLILNYYDLATQQEDVSLFYLYKVTEALQHKFGSEKNAKQAVNHNAEWNFIRKNANESYADVRHAPKPGEKTKDWTDEDIRNCFTGAEKIIIAYMESLF